MSRQHKRDRKTTQVLETVGTTLPPANGHATEVIDGPVTVEVARAAPPSAEDDELLSLNEVGRLIGKTGTTVKQWIIDGLMEAVRLPSLLYKVRRSVVNRFLSGTNLPVKSI